MPAAAAIETLTLGFMPLVDCAPLVVAKELGFAEAEGLRFKLSREISWANVRDRVIVGHFDAAHMLAPMPIASTLGLGPLATPMIAPFSLGLGGNAITLSLPIIEAMQQGGARLSDGPAALARAFAAVRRGAPRLAVVHPFSAHNYELRYWLAFAGLDPDRDAEIVVLPPPLMADALRERRIDGFCAGEPWNSLAVEAGLGAIAATKSALWRQGPDKVLGLRADFLERRPKALPPLIRALHAAARWAGAAHNHAELAQLLARPEYLDAPAEILLRALQGRIALAPGEAPTQIPDFLEFHAHAANFPWRSHALWFAAQMARWRQMAYSPERFARAAAVYRPDLFRAALTPVGVDVPRADAKVEGALIRPTPVASRLGTMVLGPDGFFDGRRFDPDAVEQYLAEF
jgi:NitT/TauT family transport system ATP-binding protein